MNRTNWKLIKTAPKDGTEIIGVHISEWGDRQKTLYGPWTVAFRSGRWQSSWDGVQVIDYMSDFGTDYKTPDLEPTHWIPLPEVVNTDPEGSSRTETVIREVRPSIPSDGFNCIYLYEDGREVGHLNGPQDDPAVIARAEHWTSPSSEAGRPTIAWLVEWSDLNGNTGSDAYVDEKDARAAASNIEAYFAVKAKARVMPLYARGDT